MVILALTFTGFLVLANVEPPTPLKFSVGARTAFVMRHLNPDPDGATDFRILGTPNARGILWLIGTDEHRYADYT